MSTEIGGYDNNAQTSMTSRAGVTVTTAGTKNLFDTILRDTSGDPLGTNANPLVVDTELTVSGVTIDNVFTYAEAPRATADAAYALIDGEGHVQVDVLSSALPTGAATEATLSNVDTALTEVSLADNMSNPTIPLVGSHLLGWNPGASEWERIRSSPVNADGLTNHNQGVLDVMCHNFMSNGTSWDRMKGDTTYGVDVDVTRVKPDGTNTMPSGDTLARGVYTRTTLYNSSGTETGTESNPTTVHTFSHGEAISHGLVADHESRNILAFCDNVSNAATYTDIAPQVAAGVRISVPPLVGGVPTAIAMEIVSSDAADDSVELVNGTADAGGSSTVLEDAAGNFVVNGVVAGDCLFNTTDNSIGVITAVGATTLTIAAGMSEGANDAGDTYYVIDDDSAGDTGVKVVEVHGLDGNYDEQSEFVQLNGTTEVATANSYYRINNIHSMMVGSGGVAAGDIDIRHTSDTPIYARLAANGNMSQTGIFTVPNGKTGYIKRWSAGSAGDNDVEILLRATCDWDNRKLTKGVFQFQDNVLLENNSTEIIFDEPLVFPEGCDIKISARKLSAGTSVPVVGSFQIYYE